jgi:hypothetical protein
MLSQREILMKRHFNKEINGDNHCKTEYFPRTYFSHVGNKIFVLPPNAYDDEQHHKDEKEILIFLPFI